MASEKREKNPLKNVLKNRMPSPDRFRRRGPVSSPSFPSTVIVAALAAVVMMIVAGDGLAACPACADNISAAGSEKGEGFALSILGLLSLPVVLVGGIGMAAARTLRKRSGAVLPIAVLSLGLLSCGGGDDAADADAVPKTPADMSKAVEVSGTVLFEGTPPAPEAYDVSSDEYCGVRHEGGVIYSNDVVVNDGKLANVFVYVSKGLEGYSFPTPTEAAVLDQRGCAYEPHMLGIMTGQPLEIRNSDSTLHNVHAMTKNNKAFNLAQDVGKTDRKTFEKEEVMIPIVCDVHGWMKSWLAVLPHPAYAVSGQEGVWSFRVPPGEYTVTAWHERYGKQEVQLTAREGEPATLNFTFR